MKLFGSQPVDLHFVEEGGHSENRLAVSYFSFAPGGWRVYRQFVGKAQNFCLAPWHYVSRYA